MPSELPPEDQPTGSGLIPTDDPSAGIADMGPNSPDNPVAIGAAFLNLVNAPGGPDVQGLANLVTPESLSAWGDFASAAERLTGCGMTSRANPSATDPEVVYVKYVTDDGKNYTADGDIMIMARAVATLVWRPELGSWRVHGLGEYIKPEEVPH